MAHSPQDSKSHGHDAAAAHSGVGHVVPVGTLVGAGLALLILTVITVAVRQIDIGEFNIAVALGVAVIKATIVILVFMHLWWDRPFNLLVFIGGVAFVLLMMGFIAMDVGAYMPSIFKGNAPDAQTTLNESAPGAPVARDVESMP